MNNKAVKLKEHPLGNEILSRIESGELVLSTGPIDTSFEWTEEVEADFRVAMEKVNELSKK